MSGSSIGQSIGSKKRNTNIELLRLFSMFLIVAYHLRNHIGIVYENELPASVFFPVTLLGSWGLVGVDIFLVISVWFMSAENYRFRFNRVLSFVLQCFSWVAAYGVVFFAEQILRQHHSIKTALRLFVKSTVNGFFEPFWSNYYWFATAYFFLMLLAPFLHRLLHGLEREQTKKLLIVFSFIPLYAHFNSGGSKICEVFYFLYFFLLVGYIRKYEPRFAVRLTARPWYIPIAAFVLAGQTALHFLENNGSRVCAVFCLFLNKTSAASIRRHPLLLSVAALCIVLRVLSKKPRYSALVNKTASHTFGVYLFHDAHCFELTNTGMILVAFVHAHGFLQQGTRFSLDYIALTAGVFILGLALEAVRNFVIQKPFMGLISKKGKDIIDKVDGFYDPF